MATVPYGVTFASLQGLGPAFAIDLARRAEALGYQSFWTAEANGPEAFGVLGAVAAIAPSFDLGTGVLALQLRTPPLTAMAAATLQSLVPDRDVLLGVGISSPVVAGRWHGSTYPSRPLAQVREFVELTRLCLSGERVDYAGEFYSVRGFRLGVRAGKREPKIVVGALNAGMLQLAGEIADGVLLNYLPASHVPWSVEQVRKGGGATIYAYVHVGIGDPDRCRELARRDLFTYATVDAYAANFERAGFGDAVEKIRERHAAGDRDGAVAAVSDEMADAIDITGDVTVVGAAVQSYVNGGVEHPIVFPLAWDGDRVAVVEATLAAARP
jgi:probable F420-dependent oxidoreductase